ncbi:MAG: hypothetical protein UY40_C0008G0018 [candidate division CPR1 bacterium GW2011_GWC1_49_13]|uniref:LVIVD repeat protein n=1 Tax=candidate division CPR1 bacterium GW2011_GWC1_49_13 TaxID=1618342 RepID=A0A0G1VH87_9BACT|nr:MAG: hypothetical protein UY40_C0008G0018 [candidate division CPR1 bacterium GW2011_GWC1_49_13]
MILKGKRSSFTILEIIIAIGLFAITVGGIAGLIAQTFSLNRLGEEESYGNFLAIEGLEATRAIARRDYFNLVNGTYGLDATPTSWEFSGNSQNFGKFTRQIVVSNVFRDTGGNVVADPTDGTLDLFTKRVEALVTWNFAPGRNNEVSLKTYFTFWNESICEWQDTVALNKVGELNLPGNLDATDIEVEEDVGYVTQGSSNRGEFYVLDLSNPVSPQIAGSLTPALSERINAVSVVGSYAYLATARPAQELLVVNVSNPASPSLVGSNGVPAAVALDVAATEDFAYLGITSNSGPEFYIYNITNPASPAVLGTFEVGKDVSAVSVIGNRAYLAVTITGAGQPNLLILDISNPSSPNQVGSYADPLAPSGAKGEAVFYAGGIAHLVISGSASDPLYYLLDVSNPASINRIGYLPAQGAMQGINDVEAGSGFALLATNKADSAILIVDIRNPAQPKTKFPVPLGPGVNGLGAEINGCNAYVASSDPNEEIKVLAPQ